MRLLKFLCISVTAAILSLSTVNAEINAAGHEDVTTYQVTDNFRTSKNILFSCMYGGSSHVNWVLTILEELSNRGHSTFFQTKVFTCMQFICTHLKRCPSVKMRYSHTYVGRSCKIFKKFSIYQYLISWTSF